MKSDPASMVLTEDQCKNLAFNKLRSAFSRAMQQRFHVIKGNIEDIWDIVAVTDALEDRLRNIAAKESYTEDNLKDMALICSFIWNTDTPVEDPQTPE